MRAPPPPCGCVGVRRARVHVPRRVPPRGARQNRLRVMFSVAGCRVFGLKSPSARVRRAASRSPRRAPPPRAPFGAPARRGGASPSPWGGGALYPVAVLACCARLLLPLRRGVCPRSAVCPRRVGRAVRLRARRFAPRASPCFFHFLAAFAAAVRRRRRGGVTPRPRRARSPSRWRAPVCPLSCPVSFLHFGNVPAACFPLRRVVRFARCLARRVPRRFARRRVSCRDSRAGWCLCPRAVPASGQGHA